MLMVFPSENGDVPLGRWNSQTYDYCLAKNIHRSDGTY